MLDLVTSPVPPGLRANALFLDADEYLRSVSHSSRVSLPSWLRSLLSNRSLNGVLSDSSLDRTPSWSVSPIFRMSSKLGIWKSLSSGSPGPQAAKYRFPSPAVGDAQQE